MTKNEYLHLEDVIGRRFGDINAAQAEAIRLLAEGDVAGANAAILSASALTSKNGEEFSVIAREMRSKLAQEPAPQAATGLRPGQVVADVGGADATVWRGSIDPNRTDITPTDWRAFLQNYERMPMVDIFSSSPAGKAKNEDGSNFTPGDQSNPVIDIDAYKRSGGIFAPWL